MRLRNICRVRCWHIGTRWAFCVGRHPLGSSILPETRSAMPWPKADPRRVTHPAGVVLNPLGKSLSPAHIGLFWGRIRPWVNEDQPRVRPVTAGDRL
jgi:hypothetical protein